MAPRVPWTAKEDALLRRRYPNTPTVELAKQLNRGISGVYQRARNLGLSKSEAYLNSPAACRLRRGDNVGAACRFPKGHVPANKGLRRPGWGPGRMKETQFKPGVRQGIAAKNWMPLGSIRKDAEGYLRIKVRESAPGETHGFGNTKVWPLLGRHIWEQAHGPIPPRHIVVFRDRNRDNCALENLELISLEENMRRNSVHNLPKPVAKAVQLLGALNRQIRKRSHVQ